MVETPSHTTTGLPTMMSRPPKVLKAVIFDFDGVIADTMPDNFRAWQRAFAEHGVAIDADAYFLHEGMGRNGIAEVLCRQNSLPLSLAPAIAERKDLLYLSESTCQVYPEIPELLHELQHVGIRIGLVTGASRERLNSSLRKDILAEFSCIVSGDDVTATKPHPEPYSRALDALAESSTYAVAVENAPLGITSAKEAGLFCIALCTTLGAEMLQNADLILRTHVDLPRFFSRYGIRYGQRGSPEPSLRGL
jgi:beta-phosphoglucomutase